MSTKSKSTPKAGRAPLEAAVATAAMVALWVLVLMSLKVPAAPVVPHIVLEVPEDGPPRVHVDGLQAATRELDERRFELENSNSVRVMVVRLGGEDR